MKAKTEQILCASCQDNGESVPATMMMPSSPDKGRTLYYSPECAAHAAGWWDGADWDGSHLCKPVTGEDK